MSRHWALIIVATLLTVAAVPPLNTGASPDGQKGLGTLRLIVFSAADAATEVARARGLFAAQGLDVDVTITPDSTTQMRGIGQGTWDIASTAFDRMLMNTCSSFTGSPMTSGTLSGEF